MTAPNFNCCFTETASFEGGYVNNPHDPGHGTMAGVTQAAYTKYLAAHGRPNADVRYISLIDRQAIYRAYYWDEVRGDDLYAGLDLVMVDTAWGSGPVEAIKLLQRTLGIPADGQFGEQTLAAVRAHEQPFEKSADLVNDLCAERMTFFRSLSTWQYFGKGWTVRLNGIRAKALAMLKRSPLPTGVMSATESPSAAASAQANMQQKEVSAMDAPANPNLLDTLENLLTATLDEAPEVEKDFKTTVAEFQRLKASPLGVDLSNVIGQLFSHTSGTTGLVSVVLKSAS